MPKIKRLVECEWDIFTLHMNSGWYFWFLKGSFSGIDEITGSKTFNTREEAKEDAIAFCKLNGLKFKAEVNP
jgi:hypothetical protein